MNAGCRVFYPAFNWLYFAKIGHTEECTQLSDECLKVNYVGLWGNLLAETEYIFLSIIYYNTII